MNKIVGIGANVYDTLIKVQNYPEEDTKLRADKTLASGGGPCATGLICAKKLGATSGYIGVLTDDVSGKFLFDDMKKRGVSTDCIEVVSGFSSFTSYILLNTENATRTCVFDKGNIPALALNSKQKKAIIDAQILMVDGNELTAAVEGAEIASRNGTKVLYDAGGNYEGIEKLLKLTDILIPSEEFALNHTQTDNILDAAKMLYQMYKPEVVVITCGKNGGIMFDGTIIHNYPAFKVDAVDSNGAGDVFHGAFAYAMTKGLSYIDCCVFSSAVSALKCTKTGARDGVPELKEVIEFLKENGYDEFEKVVE